MEILAAFAVLFVMSILFPSHGASIRPEWIMIPVVIVSGALIAGFLAAIAYAVVFVERATGSAGLGVLAGPGLFLGALFLNKFLADRSDRRRVAGVQ